MGEGKSIEGYLALVFSVGVGIGVIFFTLFVYRSNIRLYNRLVSIKASGYLTIPNDMVVAGLNGYSEAFAGALFFVLTLGLPVTLVCIGCGRLWSVILGRRRRWLIVFCLLNLLLLVAINLKGVCPVLSVYLGGAPSLIFWLSATSVPDGGNSGHWRGVVPHLFLIGLLGSVWFFAVGDRPFENVRDGLLLTDSVWGGVNDFYYRNSLYAVEAINPPRRRSMNGCDLSSIRDSRVREEIEEILIRNDYFPIGRQDAAGLRVDLEAADLLLKHGGETVLKVPIDRFIETPQQVLSQFSRLTDRFQFLRGLLFLSLILFSPLGLYVCLYLLVVSVLRLVPGFRAESQVALLICFTVGVVLLYPVCRLSISDGSAYSVERYLSSKEWMERVVGARLAEEKKMNITSLPSYQTLLHSEKAVERYWAARVSRFGDEELAERGLVLLLRDRHPNVVCQALFSLGERRYRRYIPVILEIVRVSNHWYEQWYGYRALKSLGWKQKRSN